MILRIQARRPGTCLCMLRRAPMLAALYEYPHAPDTAGEAGVEIQKGQAKIKTQVGSGRHEQQADQQPKLGYSFVNRRR